MELDVGGSVAWYVAMLVAGLVTGLVIAWLRRETKRND
jgi:flagellar biosynthesis protein FliQ